MYFSEVITALLDKQGMNREDLAKRTGIGSGHLSKILNNVIPVTKKQLEKIATITDDPIERAEIVRAYLMDIIASLTLDVQGIEISVSEQPNALLSAVGPRIYRDLVTLGVAATRTKEVAAVLSDMVALICSTQVVEFQDDDAFHMQSMAEQRDKHRAVGKKLGTYRTPDRQDDELTEDEVDLLKDPRIFEEFPRKVAEDSKDYS